MTYNFQARFVPLILSGQKQSTIRAPRRDGKLPYYGQPLHLVTGMRTKNFKRICTRTCFNLKEVWISERGIRLNHITNPFSRAEAIARRDGFSSLDELLDWFRANHGLPFHGYLITWK